MNPHPALAAAAAFERDARVKHYPADVADGRMTRDEAEADIAAWTAVADIMAGGPTSAPLTWAELALATTRALVRRNEDAETHPGNERKATRRDMVDAIDERIRTTRDSLADLNARLRAHALRPEALAA